MKMIMVVMAIMLAFSLAACASPADSRLNEMNRQAGVFIAAEAGDPEVAQAGEDIAKSAEQIQQYSLPRPEGVVYSSEFVRAEIERSKAESRGFPWEVVEAGLGIFGLGGIAELLRRLRKNKVVIKKTREAYFATVNSIKRKIILAKKAKKGNIGVYDVGLIAQDVQKDLGILQEITDLYREWKESAKEK